MVLVTFVQIFSLLLYLWDHHCVPPWSMEVLQCPCPNPEVSLHFKCAPIPLQFCHGVHVGQEHLMTLWVFKVAGFLEVGLDEDIKLASSELSSR